MNNNYKMDIGLEIHCQMSTVHKLFSRAKIGENSSPNSNIDLFDIALPGTLPVLNFDTIHYAVRTGLALDGEINKRSIFDRKHYFYPDLPSGYQITQFFEPIVKNAKLPITGKDVHIKQIHIEQDAGKLIHGHDGSYVDYNRAGVPLMEIVTEPDFDSCDEVIEFLKNLQMVLRHIEVSDADMDKGNFRCDVNISVRKVGSDTLGNRVEVKNLNSFESITAAIEYEYDRHVETLEGGGVIDQCTSLFDVDTGKTQVMRSKENAIDYRYFPDPDLPPVDIDDDFIEGIRSKMPLLPSQKKTLYMSDYGMSEYEANLLLADVALSKYFDKAASGASPKKVFNWVANELLGRIKKIGQDIKQTKCTPENIIELIHIIEKGDISGKIGKDVLDVIVEEGGNPSDIISQKGWAQVSNEDELREIINEIVSQNEGQVQKYRDGATKLMGFFVGQVMKKTGGSANPAVVNKILKSILDVNV